MFKTVSILCAVLCLIVCFNNCDHPYSTSLKSSSSQSNTVTCPPPSNPALNNPQTIDQAVALINSLPKPLTLQCFLAALAKPLSVLAVDNPFSAQPSMGPQSPRIFLLQPNFVFSVVPAGTASNLLEMSEFVTSSTSVKAEIEFPVTATVAPAAPYQRILSGSGGTNCGICHAPESPAQGSFAGPAFVSVVLQPDSFHRVSVAQLQQFSLSCDTVSDAYRCGILKTIFIDGRAQAGVQPFK